jgi:hypothetical protein
MVLCPLMQIPTYAAPASVVSASAWPQVCHTTVRLATNKGDELRRCVVAKNACHAADDKKPRYVENRWGIDSIFDGSFEILVSQSWKQQRNICAYFYVSGST